MAGGDIRGQIMENKYMMGDPLEDFKQGNDMIRLAFREKSLDHPIDQKMGLKTGETGV